MVRWPALAVMLLLLSAAVASAVAGAMVPHGVGAPQASLSLAVAPRPPSSELPARPATNPVSYYPSEPAPMGIADFGVGAGGTSYSYSTTQLMGNFTWASQNIYNDSLGSAAEDLYSVQLNVFLEFVNGGKTYTFWIQNVATMDTKTLLLQMMDCVWNATTSTATLATTGVVSGNGSVSGGVYSDDSTSLPGGDFTTLAASNFELILVSGKDASGRPQVWLEYIDSGTGGKAIPFDTVDFVFAKSVTTDDNFVVNGGAQSVWGTGVDAELMVGGPYNGDFTVAHSSTLLNMQLYRWNGHNYQAPPATWNFGSETAESISSISTTFTNDGYGVPSDSLYNGTAHNATTGALYNQYQVGVLSLSAPSATGGTVAVGAGDTPFTGDLAYLTLVPGTYPVWVNTTSSTYLGLCTITAGGNLSVTLPNTCSTTSSPPTVSSLTFSPNPVTEGNSVTVTTVVSGGTGTLSYAYTGLPAGCTTQDAAIFSCTPTASGTFTVGVTVTDTAGSGTGSGTLTVNPTSHIPVAISAFGATPNPVTLGTSTTLSVTATGGTGPLTYSYTGLPSGCAGSNASLFKCTSTEAGNFTVTVTVHDSLQTPSTATDSLVLEVNASAGAPLEITSFAASPNPVDVGSTTTFSVSTTGGTGWIAFDYVDLPPGCTTDSGATLPCTPTTAGTYVVEVEAWGSTGPWAYANTSLVVETVSPPAGPSVTEVTASPATLTIGATSTLEVTVTGGVAPLTYAWTSLPAGCSNASAAELSCTPTTTGSFTVTVTVRDSLGRTSSGSVSLVVNAATNPSPTTPSNAASPLSSLLWLAVIVGVFAVVAILAVLLIVHQRRSRPPPPAYVGPDWPPPGY